jgi:hypothetical protein
MSKPDPSTWRDRLYAALQTVPAPGKFATSAAYTAKLPDTPLLAVEGVGPLTLPLSMRQAAALLLAGEPALLPMLWVLLAPWERHTPPPTQLLLLPHAGEPAPYGKGMDTVYDEAVRRATQLAPALVTPSPAWTEAVSSITHAAAKELGVDPVSAP